MDGCRIKSFACAALVCLLAACGAVEVRHAVQLRATPPTESGALVATHLQSRFDQGSYDCSGLPAVLCSGVLMRGTSWSANYHSWIPNPTTSAGGVSFSWLRQDSNFPSTIAPNGFIVYPHFYADDPYFYQLVVHCGYVVNAGTGSLADKCRTPCHASNILTAAQWLATYPVGSSGCAFKIAPGDSAPNPEDAWMQIVAVRKARGIFSWNEIIVAPWPQTTYADMPLEAFYYTNGNIGALNNARNDQKDFRTTAGRWVPIVRWTPATSMGGPATFTYNAADQGIAH